MFFERLQSLCIRHNTDVSSVLKELGLSTSKGTAWRSGSIPKGDVLLKLANYFHVSTDYLLGNTDDPAPVDKIKKPSTPEGEGHTISFASVGRIKMWCMARKIQVNQLERFLKLQDGYFDSLGGGVVPHDIASIVADFLQVPLSSLTENKEIGTSDFFNLDDLAILTSFHAAPVQTQQAILILLGLK